MLSTHAFPTRRSSDFHSGFAVLSGSGAVARLCPTTAANLGDGVFLEVDYLGAGGRFGIGSDSNIRMSLAEELRMLELSQRLQHRQRALLTSAEVPSNGRFLYERAARGGDRKSTRLNSSH